jgi:hypothetical protein
VAGACVPADGGSAACALAGCAAGQICAEGECAFPDCAPGETGTLCAFGAGLAAASLGTCCAGACSNLLADPSNCGTCGAACASGVCSVSGALDACVPTANGAGECQTDVNCVSKMPGTVCVDATCVEPSCGGAIAHELCATADEEVGACCPAGSGGLACVDLLSDPANCGTCGWACPAGSPCVGGACGACGPSRRGAYCGDGGASSACCPAGCVDLDSDAANCGACGVRCDGGCAGGACR